MIRAIIVDDEPLAIEIIASHIEKLPEIELVGKCSNALDARQLIRDEQIDLVFLDIQMPQISGIDLVKSVPNMPAVIFTTAFSEYAVEGFELDAVDYLLKPISFDRFLKATTKAMDLIHSKNLKHAMELDRFEDDYIFVKADKKLIKIYYSDIVFIEGLKDYVIIKRKEAKRVITLQTMKSLEAKLPDQIFKRIHRSFIVNMSKIEAVMGNMVEVKELTPGSKLNEKKTYSIKHLPIGKNYREELLKLITDKKL